MIGNVPSEELHESPAWRIFLSQIRIACFATMNSGTTAQRPTSGLWIGRVYYDTTLGYPVWAHQIEPTIVWHNGAGASV